MMCNLLVFNRILDVYFLFFTASESELDFFYPTVFIEGCKRSKGLHL